MLSELKEELEYCRRKWALAREKNNESQSQWNDLRSEFSRRKLEDANNSGESGFSDDVVSDDENSDDESVKAKQMEATELAPSSKKLLRVHSVSPIRGETSRKRDSSAPPISTFLTEVLQTTSEIVPANLTQASVVTKPVENLDLKYAAKSSVVKPKTASKIVKVVACERPTTSKGGVKPKSVDEVRPRLSRELRKKVTKVKEKRKGEETLEEMFFRLSGLEPPPPEASTSDQHNDDEEYDDEEEDNEEVSANETIVLEDDVVPLTPHLETDESPKPEDISHMILSEEDEERRALRAARFQRLEEQCQQLITQVINNSTRGDELNLHLDNVQRRFTPMRESSKSVDKSDEEGAAGGCSSEMDAGNNAECLTPKEQEYTSRRAERLKRLEEECKEFLNKQNKSKIRANEINNKLDQLHQRYGSQERPEASASESGESQGAVLAVEDDAYTARRAERLKRMEVQSAELLERMDQSSSRAKNIESSLDVLHSKFDEEGTSDTHVDSQLVEECKEDEIIDVADEDIVQHDVSAVLPQPSPDENHSIETLDGHIVTENGDDENEETVTVTMHNDAN